MDNGVWTYFEKKNDMSIVMLYREKSVIVSHESGGNEVPDLKDILGENQYLSYIDAQSRYKSGDKAVIGGWVMFIAGVTSGVVGLFGGNSGFVLVGGVASVMSDILLIGGYTRRGVAAGEISRIAEGYNASHQIRPEMSLSMSPTLLYNNGQVASGVGLTLRF